MILYAAARVLGCGSVQLMVADDERRALVFTTSIKTASCRGAKVETSSAFSSKARAHAARHR